MATPIAGMPPITPQEQAALAPVVQESPKLEPAQLAALGAKLDTDFKQYETDRRLAELRWAKNLRQFLGFYDPDVESKIPQERSRAYPKLTRVKVVSMVSRLMNLLFPSDEKNWTVAPSPVPNLTTEDLDEVLRQLQSTPEQQELTDEVITAAVREFAKKRAINLELEIEDQLAEIGGSRTLNYVALCRKVLLSGVMYGAGVLKGPFARLDQQTRWELDKATRQVKSTNVETVRPQFEFVPLWDYYPDMSARYLHQLDGAFQRIVMSRQQVRQLANDENFMKEAILTYLETHATGNYKEKPWESELRVMGVQLNVRVNDGRKYEIIVWDGALSGHYLRGCGVDVPDDKLSDMHNAVVWRIGDTVIRASLNPWTMLGEEQPIPTYHHFIFEEDESCLLGNGLCNVVRDSQLAVAAAARMILDNSSVVCGPNLEVNRGLLLAGQDIGSIVPYKIWYRDDESPATANVPAVRAVQLDSHVSDLLEVQKLFEGFADRETFVNPATGGDLQEGGSEALRTAAATSMHLGNAALPFKDVVRGFDVFTESVINALIMFNKHFNLKPSLRGDFRPVARGATSLIAKEVRGIGLDSLVTTITPEEKMYMDYKKLLRERLRARDVDVDVMVDDMEAKRREDAAAQQQQAQQAQQEEFMKATVRKLLAEAVKNLTQSDKNTAGQEAAIYNAVLDGLEKGVTPAEVADARDGGPVPAGVKEVQKLLNPPPPRPVKKAA